MFPRRKERFGTGVMIGEELHLGIFDSAAGPRRQALIPCVFVPNTRSSHSSPTPQAMNVTRHNFERLFTLIQASIRDADFVAMDFEFSGLSSGGAHRAGFYGT